MLTKPLVILGTARKTGETRRAIDIAFPDGSANLVILTDQDIGRYEYDHKSANDDFLTIVDQMVRAQAVVFATPVYWYAMSGPLKNFFDRLTDLLEIAKDKGRGLANKKVWLLCTGTDETMPDGFEVPFSRTADYFSMHYCGAGYLYSGNNVQFRRISETEIAAFGRRIHSES